MKNSRLLLIQLTVAAIAALGLSVSQAAEPKRPQVTLTLDSGEAIVLELYPDQAPQSVYNFIYLIREGFFDGQAFWRIEKDRLIQSGSPSNDGDGSPGWAIKGEFTENGVDNTLKFTPGTLGLGRLLPDSASAAFFITVTDASSLDGKYAAFGRVTQGLETVARISQGAAEQISPEVSFVHKALNLVYINDITVDTFGVDYPDPIKLKEPTAEETATEFERISRQSAASTPDEE